MIRDRLIAALLFALLWPVAPVAAHPIVIHTGTVEWVDHDLRLMLAVNTHSLEHEIGVLGNGATPQHIARALGSSVHVISHQSGRISATRITVSESGDQVACDYDIPESVTTVALVHRPSDELAPLARQLQLRWSPPAARYPRVIRLTTGGNHAVLRRDGTDDNDAAGDPFAEPVLHLADDDRGAGLAIRIDYPCTLLAMWPDLIGPDDGTITAQRFRRSRAAIEQWARQRLSIDAPDRRALTFTIQRVDLLAPSGEILSDAVGGRYSIYTTRVRIRAGRQPAESDEWTEITWRGFGAALLRISVVCDRRGAAPFIGLLTPAQASVRVHHTDPIGSQGQRVKGYEIRP